MGTRRQPDQAYAAFAHSISCEYYNVCVYCVQHFVLWGQSPQPGRREGFICLEPWLGAPNSLNSLEHVARLPAGDELVMEYTFDASHILISDLLSP